MLAQPSSYFSLVLLCFFRCTTVAHRLCSLPFCPFPPRFLLSARFFAPTDSLLGPWRPRRWVGAVGPSPGHGRSGVAAALTKSLSATKNYACYDIVALLVACPTILCSDYPFERYLKSAEDDPEELPKGYLDYKGWTCKDKP